MDALSVVRHLRRVAGNTNPSTELEAKLPKLAIGLFYFFDHPDEGVRKEAAISLQLLTKIHRKILLQEGPSSGAKEATSKREDSVKEKEGRGLWMREKQPPVEEKGKNHHPDEEKVVVLSPNEKTSREISTQTNRRTTDCDSGVVTSRKRLVKELRTNLKLYLDTNNHSLDKTMQRICLQCLGNLQIRSSPDTTPLTTTTSSSPLSPSRNPPRIMGSRNGTEDTITTPQQPLVSSSSSSSSSTATNVNKSAGPALWTVVLGLSRLHLLFGKYWRTLSPEEGEEKMGWGTGPGPITTSGVIEKKKSGHDSQSSTTVAAASTIAVPNTTTSSKDENKELLNLSSSSSSILYFSSPSHSPHPSAPDWCRSLQMRLVTDPAVQAVTVTLVPTAMDGNPIAIIAPRKQKEGSISEKNNEDPHDDRQQETDPKYVMVRDMDYSTGGEVNNKKIQIVNSYELDLTNHDTTCATTMEDSSSTHYFDGIAVLSARLSNRSYAQRAAQVTRISALLRPACVAVLHVRSASEDGKKSAEDKIGVNSMTHTAHRSTTSGTTTRTSTDTTVRTSRTTTTRTTSATGGMTSKTTGGTTSSTNSGITSTTNSGITSGTTSGSISSTTARTTSRPNTGITSSTNTGITSSTTSGIISSTTTRTTSSTNTGITSSTNTGITSSTTSGTISSTTTGTISSTNTGINSSTTSGTISSPTGGTTSSTTSGITSSTAGGITSSTTSGIISSTSDGTTSSTTGGTTSSTTGGTTSSTTNGTPSCTDLQTKISSTGSSTANHHHHRHTQPPTLDSSSNSYEGEDTVETEDLTPRYLDEDKQWTTGDDTEREKGDREVVELEDNEENSEKSAGWSFFGRSSVLFGESRFLGGGPLVPTTDDPELRNRLRHEKEIRQQNRDVGKTGGRALDRVLSGLGDIKFW